MTGWFLRVWGVVVGMALSAGMPAVAQSIRFPWSGYAHDPQHDAVAVAPAQPLNRILWSAPVDLDPQYGDYGDLSIHYGSPLITRSNTVIISVKTGADSGFMVEALAAATGVTNWTQATDYILPPHQWIPSCSGTLTPRNRLYFPGGGGTVYYCDTPDATNAVPTFGQLAFYGLTNYTANSNAFLSDVFIDTPITSDRYGNIFFGFIVTGTAPLGLQGGLARIDYNGTGSWVSAASTVLDTPVSQVVMNCAPALSNDHKAVYFAVNNGGFSGGCLVELDSRTLATLHAVNLWDVKSTNSFALLGDDGSASPTVGPDGDVYFGVLGNPQTSNNYRGWLLHFNSTLTQPKLPGAFGWDDTPSLVAAPLVAGYHGTSPYLLMVKYNNYAGEGTGDGVNRIAILDPRNSETDPISGATVMAEVMSVAGPTPDVDERAKGYTNAVREWCINSAAVDPFTKSVLANSEDGNLYRWDLTSGLLSETNTLTAGVGEAYTPTVVGIDGIVYAINGGRLFAVGR